MQLEKNQYVVFPNGETQGHLEARWSETHQAFYLITDETYEDEKGRIRNVRLYSTDVREKSARPKKSFKPTEKNCTVDITALIAGETEKSYKILVGSNGCISRKNHKAHYDFIAKSICYISNGRIYAPQFAVHIEK